MNHHERIRHYNEHIYPHVYGWVKPEVWRAIDIAGDIFAEDGITGNVAEFGVHHGLFLFLIDALCEPGEQSIAVSIWDDPGNKFNNDDVPLEFRRGSLDVFKQNAERFLPGRRFVIHVRDTLSIGLFEVGAKVTLRVKFLSIDACKDVLNVCNDLCLAQEVLAPGGIIAVDDFMHPALFTVVEGYQKFMDTRNRRLHPLLIFGHKLFLTTKSEHAGHLARYKERLSGCQVIKVSGVDCLSESNPTWP